MRTISCFIFILAGCLLSNRLDAQKELRGFYSEHKGLGAFEWNGFRFYSDGRFYFEKESDFGFYAGVGDYSVRKHAIYLRFDEIPKEKRNTRVIYNSSPNGSTVIKVTDALDPHLQAGCSVVVYAGDSILDQGACDSSGTYILDPDLEANRVVVTVFTPEYAGLGTKYGQTELRIPDTGPVKAEVFMTLGRSSIQFIEGETELHYRIKIRKDYFILIARGSDFFHPGGGKRIYKRIGN